MFLVSLKFLLIFGKTCQGGTTYHCEEKKLNFLKIKALVWQYYYFLEKIYIF